MAEEHNIETREKIRDLIRKNPGSHISKIAELLNMRISEVECYLFELEKNKIITALQDAGLKRYYMGAPTQETPEGEGEETWKRIYDLISENPGLHLSKIAELLKMSKPLAEYHLLRMEKDDKITVIKEKGYKRYYIRSEQIGPKEKEILSLLRKETLLKIVLFLASHPNAKHSEILKQLDIAPSTLSYHLNNLLKHGIISVQRYGGEKGYNIKNKKELVDFVLKYRLHIVVEGFKDLWDEMNYERW